MKLKKILLYLFLLILGFWFCIGLIRTFYNFSKAPKDSQQLLISDDEKRTSTYGTFVNFCKFIENKTPNNSKLLFLSSSGKVFYVCRYELYPRQFFYITDPKQISDNSYNFLIIYQNLNDGLNENISENWKLDTYKFDETYNDKFGGKGGILKL